MLAQHQKPMPQQQSWYDDMEDAAAGLPLGTDLAVALGTLWHASTTAAAAPSSEPSTTAVAAGVPMTTAPPRVAPNPAQCGRRARLRFIAQFLGKLRELRSVRKDRAAMKAMLAPASAPRQG